MASNVPANFAFRCASPFTLANLCFNNGTCTILPSTQQERCICPAPFESDMLYFHFDNCVTVSGARTSWLSFFAPFTFIFLLILIVLLREGTRLKKREKSLAMYTILAWIATWFFVMSTYVQDGCYEACAFFTSLAFILDYVMLYQAIIVIMEPFYVGSHLQRKTPKRMFKHMTSVFCIGAGIAGVFMLVHTRDENRTIFNLATLGQCIVLWLAGMFFCASITVFAQALERRIVQVMQTTKTMHKAGSFSSTVSQPQADVVASLLPRLRALRLGSLAVGVPFLFLLIPFPVAFYFLGSIPYYFVISILHFVSNVLVVSGIAGFLWKSNRKRWQQERAATIVGAPMLLAHAVIGQTADSQKIDTLVD